MIRWIYVGLIVLFSLLAVTILGGAALAQGSLPMPGNGWGPGEMTLAPVLRTVQGWTAGGCGGQAGGMMGRPTTWGWGGNHGWGMRGGSWGHFGQQPDAWGGSTPQPLPDDGNSPKTREDVSFEADIQPIFNTRCIACHGGTAGLSLNSYEAILRGGMNGPVVISRDPSSSRLVQYVQRGYMPLGGPPLSQAQTQTLANWVAAGAPNN